MSFVICDVKERDFTKGTRTVPERSHWTKLLREAVHYATCEDATLRLREIDPNSSLYGRLVVLGLEDARELARLWGAA